MGGISKYRLYVEEHMRAIEQSGYRNMTPEQQQVIAAMSMHTVYSFLDSINIVQRKLQEGLSLEQITTLYNLEA